MADFLFSSSIYKKGYILSVNLLVLLEWSKSSIHCQIANVSPLMYLKYFCVLFALLILLRDDLSVGIGIRDALPVVNERCINIM